MTISPTSPSTCPVIWRRAIVKREGVSPVRLTSFFKLVARNEAEDLVPVQTYWAYVVKWLSIRLFRFQSKNNVIAACLEYLVSVLLYFENFFTFQLSAQLPDCLAQLYVHHVRGRELARQRIQKVLGFDIVCILIGREQLFYCFCRRHCLPGGFDSSRGEAKYFGNRYQVHPFTLPSRRSTRTYLSCPLTSKNYGGQGLNFPHLLGTGGGSIARDLHSKKLIG